jgi:hypothetical protein
MHLTEQDNSDIIFIEEPYLYQKEMAGIKIQIETTSPMKTEDGQS